MLIIQILILLFRPLVMVLLKLLDSPEPKGGDVDLVYKAWYFAHILCENVDMNIDGEGIEIIYIDGIPYNKTDIENALYFELLYDTLVCKPTYLNINNMSYSTRLW